MEKVITFYIFVGQKWKRRLAKILRYLKGGIEWKNILHQSWRIAFLEFRQSLFQTKDSII